MYGKVAVKGSAPFFAAPFFQKYLTSKDFSDILTNGILSRGHERGFSNPVRSRAEVVQIF